MVRTFLAITWTLYNNQECFNSSKGKRKSTWDTYSNMVIFLMFLSWNHNKKITAISGKNGQNKEILSPDHWSILASKGHVGNYESWNGLSSKVFYVNWEIGKYMANLNVNKMRNTRALNLSFIIRETCNRGEYWIALTTHFHLARFTGNWNETAAIMDLFPHPTS